jgi:hypothetical protein
MTAIQCRTHTRACALRHRSSKAKDHFVAMVSHEARAAAGLACSCMRCDAAGTADCAGGTHRSARHLTP